jgi:hypothetical protein
MDALMVDTAALAAHAARLRTITSCPATPLTAVSLGAGPVPDEAVAAAATRLDAALTAIGTGASHFAAVLDDQVAATSAADGGGS